MSVRLMRRVLNLFQLTALSTMTLVACGGAHPEPATPPSGPRAVPPPTVVVTSGFSDGGWGDIGGPGNPLTLRVPDVSSWKVDGRGHWLTLLHRASSSRLEARIWTARRGVHREECERQLRLWRALPNFTEEHSVDRRMVQAPPGFETDIRVEVVPRSQGAHGWVVAVGASTRRCFAALFSTAAQGQGFEQALGERLGLVSQEVLPLVALRVIGDGLGAERRP